jgi:hypothetical protein
VVRVDLAAQGRADPADRVTLVDPEDMNRVVAATVVTAAVMAPADLASRAVPVVRVGMIPAGPEAPVGMILGDPGGLRVPNPVVRVDLASRAEMGRVDPGSREATDLSLGRALLGRMPMRPHLTVARPVRLPVALRLTVARQVPMPALLHLTQADRRTPAARRAEATRAVAIRRAEAIPSSAGKSAANVTSACGHSTQSLLNRPV